MDNVMFKEKKNTAQRHDSNEINPILNGLMGLGFIVISAFLIFNSLRSFQIANDKLGILEKARKDVTDFRLKNISLILEKEKIETDDYTETDIRNRLKYSKKNEVLFVLSDESVDTALIEVNEILKDEAKAEEQQSVVQKWISFFDGGI